MKNRQWPYAGTTNYPPHAAAYLEKRGLLEAAKHAGVVYLTKEEATKAVGIPPKSKKPSDGLAIPATNGNKGDIRYLREGASPKIKRAPGAANAFFDAPFPTGSELNIADIKLDATISVLFLESGLKALACSWHGLPAIGLNGGYGWMSDHEPIADFADWKWVGRLVVLCFDYDAVTKAQVRQALKRLGNHLQTLGARVRIKLLPSPDGKNVGADDYIARYGIEKFKALPNTRLSDPRFADWEAHSVVQELNKKLGFIMHGGRATVLSVRDDPEYPGTSTIALSRVSDIKLEYANQFYIVKDTKGVERRKSKFDRWLNDPLRRVVRRLTLIPGAAPGFDPKTGDWNLWQGWGVVAHEPDDQHTWEKLKAHIQDVVASGDEKHAAYILNWLAYCVQHPDQRPEVALVLMGGEGAGKGIVLNSLVRIFGRHGLHLVSQRQLVGNFNAHLRDALFVFADEAFFAGDRASIGTVKALITEPTTVIEAKFVDAYTLPNYRKIAIASNESWVVPADTDARRFAVFRVSAKRKGNLEYFKAIGDELSNGGYEAMLYELQHRDLNGFDPRSIPTTDALLDQKKLSWDETTAWWFERLCEGKLHDDDSKWTGVAFRDDVLGEISQRTTSHYERKALAMKIVQALRKVCPKLGSDRRIDNRGNRQRRTHLFPPLDKCRIAFAKALRMRSSQINWETGEINSGDAS